MSNIEEMLKDFKLDSYILKREFSKRTIYGEDQYYDIEVVKTNDIISIDISGGQQLRIHGDKELLEQIIKDLQKIVEL